MHPLLARQLKKLGLDEGSAPDPAAWQKLLERVAQTYADGDQDRYMLERSLDTVSNEMTTLYQNLRERSEAALAGRTRELEESLALADAIRESVAQGILVVEDSTKVISMNQAFVVQWGVPDDVRESGDAKMLLEHCARLVHPTSPLAQQGFGLVDGETRSGENVLADGRVFEHQASHAVTRDGRHHVAVWSYRDVSEERRLAEQRMIVAERMAAVGQLVASVAHEINNPLASILGNLEYVQDVLGEDNVPVSEITHALADARDGLWRVRDIVRDLRVLSRADDEAREPVSIPRVLDAALSTANHQIKHRARVVRRIEATPPVEANEARLHQVFLNLLMNAAQAIPAGRVNEHTIEVSAKHDVGDRVVRVTIADTGAGIAPENVERIFDAFFTTKPIGMGTGLGLSICKGIVEKCGGRIDVTSALGKGARFDIVLPIAEAHTIPSVKPTAPAGRAAQRRRVLVVDDEPLARRWMMRALGTAHEVVSVGSVSEACDTIEAGEFDVILCDVMMPDRTGRDLYAHLKATRPELLSRLVFMSGGAFTEGLQSFLAAVPNLKLDKPMTKAALEQAIERFPIR